LKQGILALKSNPIFNYESYNGLSSTVGIIQDLLVGEKDENLEKIKTALDHAILQKSNSLVEIKENFDNLKALSDNLAVSEEQGETGKWLQRLKNQIEKLRADLYQQIPWFSMLPIPESFRELSTLNFNNSFHTFQDANNEMLQQISE